MQISRSSFSYSTKLFAALLVFAILILKKQNNIMNAKPPAAQKQQYTYSVGKEQISDEYNWLRDKDWPNSVTQKSILDHLVAENNYAHDAFFTRFKREKNRLFDELKARIKLEDKSTEIKNKQYYYYSKIQENNDYQIYCRREGPRGKEEVILDVNNLAQGKSYTRVSVTKVSPEQNLLAYGVDHKGDEKYTIHVIDLKTGQHLPDIIHNVHSDIIWHEKLPGFFYVSVDENLRATKVLFHLLGDAQPDKLILHETNHLYQVAISKTASKRYLCIDSGGAQENQIHTIDLESQDLSLKLFQARIENALYSINHNDKYFYILSNDSGANFRLAITDINNTSKENWRDYIPCDKEKYLKTFDISKNYIILNYKSLGLPMIVARDLKSQKDQIISFPDQAYTASAYCANFEEDDLRISYSAPNRPDTVYQYNYHTQDLTALKTKEVVGGFNPDEYMTERVWAQSDGVKVPISIFYKKDMMKKDSSNPLYLYGYGSYGIAMEPMFRSNILSLVNRGFIFAIAHIRGGDELGRHWYEDAKFLNKKRTFQDFIAVSEHLIESGYTAKEKIAIAGGSAGGLLIGNVINQRPELYKVAIAHVPFVDVLNTMLDDTLPLTPGEYKEWGNPKDPEFFKYIQSYSPYDNVKAQNYPHIFVTTGTADPRVGYYEATKWVARLRAIKTDDNLLLLKTDLDSGHFGSSGRFDYLNEVAQEYLFILAAFNIKI